MVADRWLPNGFRPRADVAVGHRVAAGEQWQLYEAGGGGRVLVAMADLAQRWLADGLLVEGQLHRFDFGRLALVLVEGGRDYRLEPVDAGAVPRSAAEVQALVAAILASRATGCRAAFDDAVYVERLSRLLPDYSPN